MKMECWTGESMPLPKFIGETVSQIRLILEEEPLPEILGLDSFQIGDAPGIGVFSLKEIEIEKGRG